MKNRLSFVGAGNISDPTLGAQRALANVNNNINAFRDKQYKDKLLAERQAQNAIENERANAQLAMQQERLNRTKAGDQALTDYAQQIGNYQSDVVTPEDAAAINAQYQANPNVDVQSLIDAAQNKYNAQDSTGAQSRLDMLSSVAMPSGDYNPERLLNLRKQAVAEPQGILDNIAASKAAEAQRQQKMLYDRNLAKYKQDLRLEAGTVTMSKGTPGTSDYRETSIPIGKSKVLEDAGWSIGKAKVGKNSNGNNTTSKTFDKALNFTKDVTTNARLGKQLTEVAKEYNVDPKSMHLALNTAKEDQNNFLWWRDAASSLGFDTEPSKQDVLSRIPSGYVNSENKAVSIADEEGYLKDVGVDIFKDGTTGKYVNRDVATGEILTQADVQKRIKSLSGKEPIKQSIKVDKLKNQGVEREKKPSVNKPKTSLNREQLLGESVQLKDYPDTLGGTTQFYIDKAAQEDAVNSSSHIGDDSRARFKSQEILKKYPFYDKTTLLKVISKLQRKNGKDPSTEEILDEYIINR